MNGNVYRIISTSLVAVFAATQKNKTFTTGEKRGRDFPLRLLAAASLAFTLCASPLAACSGLAVRIETRDGGSRVLQDVCIFNKGDAPTPTVSVAFPPQIRPGPAAPIIVPPPTIDLNLADGSEVDIRFDRIRQIGLDGVTQEPDEKGQTTHLFANIHIVLKSGKGLEGKTSLARMMSLKYETDPDIIRNIKDPFVIRGKDPEIDGAEVKLRVSQVKDIVFPDSNSELPVAVAPAQTPAQ